MTLSERDELIRLGVTPDSPLWEQLEGGVLRLEDGRLVPARNDEGTVKPPQAGARGHVIFEATEEAFLTLGIPGAGGFSPIHLMPGDRITMESSLPRPGVQVQVTTEWEYRLFQAHSALVLSLKVSDALNAGWYLEGSPFSAATAGGRRAVYQAMSREIVALPAKPDKGGAL